MFYKKKTKETSAETGLDDNSNGDDIQNSELEIQYSTRTDEGRVRKNNEDSLCFIKPNDAGELVKKGVLAIVADGMGGHAGGEVASKIAVDTIGDLYYQSDRNDVVQALSKAVHSANDKILKTAQKDHLLKGMGTTMTSLVIKGKNAYFAHIGDSRLYHYRNGLLNRVSNDHTLVQQMVDQGEITLFEAENHSQKNVLLQALGTKQNIELQTGHYSSDLKPGDRFLLCSDGLTDLVKDIEIQQVMEMSSIYMIAICLTALAKERGGHDNISMVIIQVVAPTPKNDQKITRDIVI